MAPRGARGVYPSTLTRQRHGGCWRLATDNIALSDILFRKILTPVTDRVTVLDMDRDSDRPLSPAVAAKRAGCGRTSIMRALESKALKATRDNRNHWQIDPMDLDQWAKNRDGHVRSAPVTDRDTVQGTDRSDVHAETLADLAAAQARVEELRDTIDRIDARHDAEIKRLERIIEQLTQPKPTLLERISGAIRTARGV
jgi:predicted ribosome quality control (RQC) complex YloA/Tae2 family protein